MEFSKCITANIPWTNLKTICAAPHQVNSCGSFCVVSERKEEAR